MVPNTNRSLFALAGLALAVVFPLFDHSPYHVNLAILIFFYGINAMALDVVLGVAGQISLCQSVFYGMGAYVSGLLNVKLGLDFWLCLPTALIVSGLLAFLVGLTSLRFRGHYLAMVTLAIVIIFIQVVREWDSLTGGPDGFYGTSRPAIGSFVFDTETKYYYLVLVFTVVSVYFAHFVVRGRTGRALAVVRQNETLSNTLGINPMSYKLKAFVLSGIYGGLAGSLYAHYSSYIGAEDFSLGASITFLCMIVVGGLRTGVWGGMLGAALLTLLTEFLSALVKFQLIPTSWEFLLKDFSYVMMIYGAIVLVIALYLPRGIVGLIGSVANRLHQVIRVGRAAEGQHAKTSQ